MRRQRPAPKAARMAQHERHRAGENQQRFPDVSDQQLFDRNNSRRHFVFIPVVRAHLRGKGFQFRLRLRLRNARLQPPHNRSRKGVV